MILEIPKIIKFSCFEDATMVLLFFKNTVKTEGMKDQ